MCGHVSDTVQVDFLRGHREPSDPLAALQKATQLPIFHISVVRLLRFALGDAQPVGVMIASRVSSCPA